MLYNNTEQIYMAVREPEGDTLKILETLWSVWPTWESWTWPGFEGKDLQVEVCSRYPKVRLYLNNKLVGEQATTREQQYKAVFNVPYVPGNLSAVGVTDNKESEAIILKTAGNAAIIRLIPDRIKISADGQDLSFITVEVTDKDGIVQPNAQNQLHFSVSGPGVIAGVDNADIKDLDPYSGTSRKAWHGRALVAVRSTRNAGNIKLTVSSEGITGASVIINAELK
jgi:beta-galactosidase